jgi:hypothetical protein
LTRCGYPVIFQRTRCSAGNRHGFGCTHHSQSYSQARALYDVALRPELYRPRQCRLCCDATICLRLGEKQTSRDQRKPVAPGPKAVIGLAVSLCCNSVWTLRELNGSRVPLFVSCCYGQSLTCGTSGSAGAARRQACGRSRTRKTRSDGRDRTERAYCRQPRPPAAPRTRREHCRDDG